MKTIQIIGLTNKQNKSLIKILYRKKLFLLAEDEFCHFFFEPDLIIRTSLPCNILDYLDSKNIKWKMYQYPFTKKGYGENKKYKEFLPILNKLYHLQSMVALTVKKGNKRSFIINRFSHCLINQLGYSYYDESKHYIASASGYLRYEYKEKGKFDSWFLSKVLGLIRRYM